MNTLKSVFRNKNPSAPARKAQKILYSKLSPAELEKGYIESRVYQDKNLAELMNQIMVNKSVQVPTVVDNADKFYDLSKHILGMKKFFCFFNNS